MATYLSFLFKNLASKLNQAHIKCIRLQIKVSKPSHFLIFSLFMLSK